MKKVPPHPDPALLSLYHDGEGPEEMLGGVERHLAECAECRTALERLRTISHELSTTPDLQAPASILRSVRREVLGVRPRGSTRWWLGWAAAALLLVGGSLGWWTAHRSTPNEIARQTPPSEVGARKPATAGDAMSANRHGMPLDTVPRTQAARTDVRSEPPSPEGEPREPGSREWAFEFRQKAAHLEFPAAPPQNSAPIEFRISVPRDTPEPDFYLVVETPNSTPEMVDTLVASLRGSRTPRIPAAEISALKAKAASDEQSELEPQRGRRLNFETLKSWGFLTEKPNSLADEVSALEVIVAPEDLPVVKAAVEEWARFQARNHLRPESAALRRAAEEADVTGEGPPDRPADEDRVDSKLSLADPMESGTRVTVRLLFVPPGAEKR